MSLFQTLDVPCPVCTTPVEFEIVHSVNADRRPDLRAEILDGAFQKKACPACGDAFRMEPEFSYLHVGSKLFLSAWPIEKLADWGEWEQRAREAFDRFFGAQAGEAAAGIGSELSVRTVFGWAALREKIVALEQGIDDVTLELVKVLLMRMPDAPAMDADYELRLLETQTSGDGDRVLVLGQFTPGVEQPAELVRVPASLLDEVAADADGWLALRGELTTGPFVDVARLLMPPVALGA